MSVAAGVERRALKDGLPALGKLTMWLWAWGLMMLLTLFCRAMFGTADGLVGWVPWGGKIAKRGIHKIEQKVSNYIGGAVRGIDGHIATSWHTLAAVVRSIPSALIDDAALLFGLAAALVVLPSQSLVKYLIRVATAPIRSAELELEKLLSGLRRRVLGLGHFVRHNVWARIAALAAAVAGIAHDLPHLRARDKYIEKELAKLRKWARGRKLTLTTGAFIGALVWALGKMGIGWVRCTRNKKLMKDLACSPKGDFLAGLLEAGLLIVGTISIVELAEELQDEMGLAVDGITKLVREQTG